MLTSGPGYTVISNPSMVVRPIAPKPLTPVGNLRPIGPGNIRAQVSVYCLENVFSLEAGNEDFVYLFFCFIFTVSADLQSGKYCV